jgi:hypothetical protein
MADNEESKKSSGNALEKLPFVLISAGFLFSGGVFLLVNLPLIIALATNEPYGDIGCILNKGVFEFWKIHLSHDMSAGSIFAITFVALVLGLILSPLDKLLTYALTVTARGMAWCINSRLASKTRKLFSATKFANDEYPAFLSWLLRNPLERSQWEWEFFLYQLHWTLCTNALIFVSLCVALVLAKASLSSTLLLAGAGFLFFAVYGLSRSYAMGLAHDYLLARFEAQRAASEPSPQGHRAKRLSGARGHWKYIRWDQRPERRW